MSTREAWSLDTLAREFHLIEKEDAGKSTTRRAELVTLLA
jgi:hypothetical protein